MGLDPRIAHLPVRVAKLAGTGGEGFPGTAAAWGVGGSVVVE